MVESRNEFAELEANSHNAEINMQTHKPDTRANSASKGELNLTNEHTEYTKCSSVECSLYPDSNRASTSSSSPGSWMKNHITHEKLRVQKSQCILQM